MTSTDEQSAHALRPAKKGWKGMTIGILRRAESKEAYAGHKVELFGSKVLVR